MRRRKLCVSINYRKCSPAIYMNQAGAWRRFKLPFNCWTDPNRRSFSLIFTLPPALKVASLPALLRLLCTKKKKKKRNKKENRQLEKTKTPFCVLVGLRPNANSSARINPKSTTKMKNDKLKVNGQEAEGSVYIYINIYINVYVCTTDWGWCSNDCALWFISAVKKKINKEKSQGTHKK